MSTPTKILKQQLKRQNQQN